MAMVTRGKYGATVILYFSILTCLDSLDVEEARGNLHFVDWPDAPGNKPIKSRLAVHIRDEPRLPALLRSSRYM